MLEIRNRTPYVAAIVPGLDAEGRDFATVVVKGTFTIPASPTSEKQLPIADEQLPLVFGDEFYGEPGLSSLRYEAEIGPLKSGTDIVLVGHAHAPGRPVRELDVTLEAGPIAKTVRVFGDRVWRSRLSGIGHSEPEPFELMPLVYERAFGGPDRSQTQGAESRWDDRNPVGTGFAGGGRAPDGLPLPNLEAPDKLISKPADRPPPSGFGFIGRHWEPRKSFAGTYDEAWQADRCPLLPQDFDPRHHRSAHPDLCAPGHFRGGEAVRIRHASPDGELRFPIPGLKLEIKAKLQGEELGVEPALDTVLIEPDLRRTVVTWKASIPCSRKFLLIDYVRIRELERSA